MRQSTINVNYDTNKELNGQELTQAVRRKIQVICESASKPEESSSKKIWLQNTGSSHEPQDTSEFVDKDLCQQPKLNCAKYEQRKTFKLGQVSTTKLELRPIPT